MAFIHIKVGNEQPARLWVPCMEAVHCIVQKKMEGKMTWVPSWDNEEAYEVPDYGVYNRFLMYIRSAY